MTISSFSMVVVFYMFVMPLNLGGRYMNDPILEYIIRFIAPLAMVLLLAILSLYLAKHTAITSDNIVVEHFHQLEGSIVPTYMGLFVISLGIGGLEPIASITILIILFVLWCCIERNSYFNLIWLFMGYNFYEVQTKQGNSLTLILRRPNLKTSEVSIGGLTRINEYTYMEI